MRRVYFTSANSTGGFGASTFTSVAVACSSTPCQPPSSFAHRLSKRTMLGGGPMMPQYKKPNPFSTTSTTINNEQPAEPTIPPPIHPDFEIAMAREVRKAHSLPHKKGVAAAEDTLFGGSAKKQYTEEKKKIVSDFEVEPPMMQNSGLAAGASKREDASQGVAAAVANVFETEQRHEELRKHTTRIIDKRRLVVNKETGEVLRRSDEEVAACVAKSTQAPDSAAPSFGNKKKKKGGLFSFFGGKKDKAEKQKEAERTKGLSSMGNIRISTNLDLDDEVSEGSTCSSGVVSGDAEFKAAKGKKYRFFEDQYPKQAPSEAAAKRYEYYEEMDSAAKVKCMEDKGPPLSESEKLHQVHEWKQDREGTYIPNEKYGWAEEWGPEPGEEGHSEWYKKNRMYMSYEEKSRLDLKNGVPLEKGQFRHHEMPAAKKMKSAYEKLTEESGGPQMFGMNERGYDAKHSYEEKKDYIMGARDEYMKEWLAKPGVTPENLAKTIGDYNGTAKKQHVKPVQRKPEWEIGPLPDHDD